MEERTGAMADDANWVVDVDRDLEDLVPVFMDARHADLGKLASGLAASDFTQLRIVGHSMKGAGFAYGFRTVGEMGDLIETAALAGDAETIRVQAERLRDYMGRVQIRFV